MCVNVCYNRRHSGNMKSLFASTARVFLLIICSLACLLAGWLAGSASRRLFDLPYMVIVATCVVICYGLTMRYTKCKRIIYILRISSHPIHLLHFLGLHNGAAVIMIKRNRKYVHMFICTYIRNNS